VSRGTAAGAAIFGAESTASAQEVLRRLELAITGRLDGMLHGDHLGLVPGHGSEVGETRSYQPGDDVRRIDWNVTARLQAPHVRETIADRELETWLLVDRSPSLAFGTARCEKRDLALAACAAVGFLTARTGNRIGAVLLDGAETHTVPARSGRNHLLALLQRAGAPTDRDGTGAGLGAGLARLAATTHRRGLVAVISDFLDDSSGWADRLRAVTSRHDVLCIELVDPRELDLVDVGLITFADPETGNVYEVATGDRRMRERFATAARAQREANAAAIRHSGADHLVLRTDRDWLEDLVRFVAARRRRLTSAAHA
jgi:uncharacterized protein (DUF58 family)